MPNMPICMAKWKKGGCRSGARCRFFHLPHYELIKNAVEGDLDFTRLLERRNHDHVKLGVDLPKGYCWDKFTTNECAEEKCSFKHIDLPEKRPGRGTCREEWAYGGCTNRSWCKLRHINKNRKGKADEHE
jgi:hypothetical protein